MQFTIFPTSLYVGCSLATVCFRPIIDLDQRVWLTISWCADIAFGAITRAAEPGRVVLERLRVIFPLGHKLGQSTNSRTTSDQANNTQRDQDERGHSDTRFAQPA